MTISKQQLNVQTSSHDPNLKIIKSNHGTIIPISIDGCTVSFSSTPKETDESIKTVKDILLSAYRTKITSC